MSADTPELEDPGDTNRRQQVQQLNTIREQIAEIRTRGQLKMPAAERDQALYGYAREYARLLEPYLRDPELQRDNGDTLWSEREYQFTVSPPDPSRKDILSQTDSWERPAPREFTLSGIREFVGLPDDPEIAFKFEQRTPVNGQEQRRVSTTARPPEDVVSRIVSDLDAFRRRVGLGLQIEEEIPPVEFES